MQVNETCVFSSAEKNNKSSWSCKTSVNAEQPSLLSQQSVLKNLLNSGIRFIPGSGTQDPGTTQRTQICGSSQ